MGAPCKNVARLRSKSVMRANCASFAESLSSFVSEPKSGAPNGTAKTTEEINEVQP